MDGFYHPGIPPPQQEWMMSGQSNVVNYSHGQVLSPFTMTQHPAPVQPPPLSNNFADMIRLQLEMINSNQPLPPMSSNQSLVPTNSNQSLPSLNSNQPLPSMNSIHSLPPTSSNQSLPPINSNQSLIPVNSNQPLPPTNIFDGSKSQQLTSFGPPKTQDFSLSDKYNPFVEDADADMEISDEEKESQNASLRKPIKAPENLRIFTDSPVSTNQSLEVRSGAAFYQGLILYIPPFEQLAHTYRGSPALKMLYASFEFSFRMPVRIETKPRENEPNMSDAIVYFKDHIISMGSGFAPHVEASVRALELLSETCYTIQAKEDYFTKCKLVDAENMKTLNLKKWEAVSEKYPKIVEVTKESHIQKTFAVFLANHTSTGMYEDIVCCNLTRQEVNNIKSVVEFFHLTMLPCSISTNLSKKSTPCVVSIHKYTSAKKLLDILVECGGENDKFILYPPDTFKEFYKLHPHYWDPNQRNKPGNKVLESKSTLEDPTLQSLIMEPYKNVIPELFEKHKTLPQPEKPSEDSVVRKAGDDFMKNTFQIDMAQSKNVAPVERMQLLLKYMEQLQEYGSRVLTSGRADMIKIYHNAIDNVRKDLDECRKDIEKEQKSKEKSAAEKTNKTSSSNKSRSPVRRRKTPPRRRSKSPVRSHAPTRRSLSPRRRAKSKSPPRRPDRTRRSPSPRRRPRSPVRRPRSKSPRRPPRVSPPRRGRSPQRVSPPRRRSPKPSRSLSKEDDVFISIFKDQFRRYMDTLRRFRIEIEDTPIERRALLMERLFVLRDQLARFKKELMENPKELGEFQYELEICRDEILEQNDLIHGKPGPNDLPPSPRPIIPAEPYPLPEPRPPLMGLPRPAMFGPAPAYRYPY